MRLATFACLAVLAATPVVAQWTVTRFAGKPADPVPPPLQEASIAALALNPAGSTVVANGNVIWRLRAGGLAERIAGTAISGFSGDGGPATAAQLSGARDAQSDAAGHVYFLDEGNRRIRRIDTSGIITTVAGTGVTLVSGMDLEGPGISRSLGGIGPFVVRGSGDIYFSDSVPGGFVVRRLRTSGQLEVIAGVLDNCSGLECFDPNQVAALWAHLQIVRKMAFDPAGNLYFAEGPNFQTIRRLSTDGFIAKIGGYCPLPCSTPVTDGQLAFDQYFGTIDALAADAFGNVFVSHRVFGGSSPTLVRRIAPGGVIQTIPGAFGLHTDSTGRVVYRIGSTLYDATNEAVITTIPPVVVPPPAPFVSPPDGTLSQDIPSLSSGVVSHAGELHYFEAGCLIRKIDGSGILRTVARVCSGGTSFGGDSIAFDSQDRLWFSPVQDGIFRILPGGGIVQEVSPENSGRTPFLAFDARDRLHMMTPFSSLKRLEAEGTFRGITPPETENPRGFPSYPFAIGNDPQGNVYFSAFIFVPGGNFSTYRVNDDGTATKVFGASQDMRRISVDASGRLWNGLTFTSSAGTFSPGLRGFYGGDGGPVQAATFGSNLSSTLAPDGSLYVFDNGITRKLSPVGRAPTPVISIGGVVNAASYIGGPIASQELITIFGVNLGGPVSGVDVGQAVNNTLPPAVGRTKVFFNGTEGKITAVTSTQINVFVPRFPFVTFADIVVLVDDAPSLPMRVPLAPQAFGLFAMDASGSGQGAILNQNGSLNGPTNPARRGDIVSLFGTGAGLMFPDMNDGALVISTPYPKPDVPVTVKVDGVQAEVLYAGAAPTLPRGAFQINVRIPLSLPPVFIPPGDPRSISVTVGSSTTTRNITVWAF